ncbi:MAG: glycoside hydrolase family 3 C-terminal domain-containing protein, partial [Vallitaleaceae bacterium]|nr:glycoside hydrolase family 3 C-terminal domain-containing protein [Vallitaleaceae bacterium]
VCVGLNSMIEGEEGDEGNSRISGDKVDLLLPGLQNQLLEAVVATGTPTIAVILAGSAMDLTWAQGHADAVIQAWYPGPEGGIALAELLFGKTDFSGRLPVTFVKHTDDLPAFEDYTMTGRTYRFMEKDPLYTFGYGLSYNEYSYSDISLSKSVVGADENVTLSVKVTNDSTMAGREVVQAYLKDLDASVRVANYNLVGFMSILLQPGETREVAFEIESDQMCIVDAEGEFVLEAGKFAAFVGGTGPDKVTESLTGKKVLSIDFEVKL